MESLENCARKLQRTVTILSAGLRTPADKGTALTFQTLFGSERLSRPFALAAAAEARDSTVVHGISHLKAVPSRDVELCFRMGEDSLGIVQLLAASAAPFLLATRGSLVVHASAALYTILGLSREELLGRRLSTLYVRRLQSFMRGLPLQGHVLLHVRVCVSVRRESPSPKT